MTSEQKNIILQLRTEGVGIAQIAVKLGLSKNTVKSFCRRKDVVDGTSTGDACLCCGKPIIQIPGRKQKKYCSDICRYRYKSTHPNGNAAYEYFCPTCGTAFFAYGNQHRKYCSHACYIRARYGGDR